MSDDQMRRELGLSNTQQARKHLEEWNYNNRTKHRTRDFHMLFDRIYSKLSVEEIAKRYPWKTKEGDIEISPQTVQRNTAKLAALLGIELPRAKKKQHTTH